MERKPFALLRREHVVIGWVLIVLGLVGIVTVIAENPHWWAPLVSAAFVAALTAPWYWFVMRPSRRTLDTAAELPEDAVIETPTEFRRRQAVRMGAFVIIVLAVANLVWEGGSYFSAAGFTAIGASFLLYARLIARREESEGVTFFRERRLRGRNGQSAIFKRIRTGDGPA